jgi:uncharacterized protein (DUF58 family)
VKWFVGVLLLLLAALVLESGLLAYAAYVLLGLLLIGRLLARGGVENLSARRSCKLGGEEVGEAGPGLVADVGDRVSIALTVSNSGRLPVPWVLLEDLLPRRAVERRHPSLEVKGKRLKIASVPGGGEVVLRYRLECLKHGYFALGPLVLESGDLFGLHRRYRVLTRPRYLLVLPKVVPLLGYEVASRRPVGDVRLTHRLFEDPTRLAGVRPYEYGDPLNRIHWRATARTGALHTRVCEPSCLAGATVVLDFHKAGYHQRGEPHRSELAVTAAASLANAVQEMGQQVGLVTNAGDAARRLRTAFQEYAARSRRAALQAAEQEDEEAERLEPLRIETRRGAEQLQRIREALARAELNDGLTFAGLIAESASRLPRDATVLAVLPDVPEATAITLGNLRRQGFAVAVVLVMLDDEALERSYARLTVEGVRDIRHLHNEEELSELCQRSVDRSAPYSLAGF